MLSEAAVSAILQASITGAGLVLAVYALVTPLSHRIFAERAKILDGKIEEFEKQRCELTLDSSDKEIKQLQKLRKEIEQIKIFPRYLGGGIALTFAFYMLSVTFSTFWLLYTDFRTLNTEIDIIVTFWPANILFMVVGVLVIFEVFQSMKKEFEEIKEKQKRVKLDK
jgi:hypothetical protein